MAPPYDRRHARMRAGTPYDARAREGRVGRHEGVPIVITAGNAGIVVPAALDRFARLGDGLIATAAYADEYRVLRARAEEALAAHDRVLPDFPLYAYTSVRLEDDRATAERIHAEFLAACYGGPGH